jgi:hypothetical protein
MIICQDRLGTNIGKTQRREYRFFLQSPQWPAQIGNGLALSSFETLSTDSDPDEWCGNVAFWAPFADEKRSFVKTGSLWTHVRRNR